MILLVGVSYTSAIRVENKTPIVDNQPPGPPDIDAPATIWVKEEVTICLYSVDPEGDNVSFYIEWGDGTSDGWTDYIPSGAGFAILHKWDKVNWDNVLHAKAKDIHGNESDWAYVPIPIVKSKDCGCNKVSDADIIRLEKQLDRLDRYTNLLLVLSKDNPEIKQKWGEMLDVLNSDRKWDFPIICNLLLESYIHLGDFCFYFVNMIHKGVIYVILFVITLIMGASIYRFMVKLDCDNLPYI